MKRKELLPGNAGLRTRRIGNTEVRTGKAVESASSEPRVPGFASSEPRVPGFASSEPRVPGFASSEPRVPGFASSEPRVPRKPRGWHSRGYLPHFDSNEVIQHVTFHLADSLPKEALQLLLAQIEEMKPEHRDIEKHRRLEALRDAGHGACWLQRPDCAQIVQDALLYFDGERYRMIAWVVMPNHVHALFQTMNEWSMNTVIGSWKTFTANAIGRLIRQPNEAVPHVWHPEFWDRYIRNENHLTAVIGYIHNNPVKAGLVSRPEDWVWSSAYSRTAGLRTRPRNAGLRTRKT